MSDAGPTAAVLSAHHVSELSLLEHHDDRDDARWNAVPANVREHRFT
jgi:hypothetical protein